MKTLVIFACVLTIAAMAHGYDFERIMKFKANLFKCHEELGIPLLTFKPDIIKCALKKDSEIFNPNGEFIKDNVYKAFEDVISDKDQLQDTKQLFTKCYNDAIHEGLTGEDQTLKISSCSWPALLRFIKED